MLGPTNISLYIYQKLLSKASNRYVPSCVFIGGEPRQNDPCPWGLELRTMFLGGTSAKRCDPLPPINQSHTRKILNIIRS